MDTFSYTGAALGVSTFESTPLANTDGVLSACAGSQISITCRHSNLNSGVTPWIFSPPVDCSTTIDHNTVSYEPCGPFTFQGVTAISIHNYDMITAFSSTAVATANTSMTGTVVSCQSGLSLRPTIIGSITICVTGNNCYSGLKL